MRCTRQNGRARRMQRSIKESVNLREETATPSGMLRGELNALSRRRGMKKKKKSSMRGTN